jgi:Domain of unknown function (DUF1902)
LVFVKAAGGEQRIGTTSLNVIRPINIDIAHDSEAHIWIAIAPELSLACEAKTVAALHRKLSLIVEDLVEGRELGQNFGKRRIKFNRLSIKQLIAKFDL